MFLIFVMNVTVITHQLQRQKYSEKNYNKCFHQPIQIDVYYKLKHDASNDQPSHCGTAGPSY